MFITATDARGIVPPNLHTESQSMHLFITKFVEVGWVITISSGNRCDYYNYLQESIIILRPSLVLAQCHLVVVCGGLLDEGL